MSSVYPVLDNAALVLISSMILPSSGTKTGYGTTRGVVRVSTAARPRLALFSYGGPHPRPWTLDPRPWTLDPRP
eukprot:3785956-Rhodomonas_salina.1